MQTTRAWMHVEEREQQRYMQQHQQQHVDMHRSRMSEMTSGGMLCFVARHILRTTACMCCHVHVCPLCPSACVGCCADVLLLLCCCCSHVLSLLLLPLLLSPVAPVRFLPARYAVERRRATCTLHHTTMGNDTSHAGAGNTDTHNTTTRTRDAD